MDLELYTGKDFAGSKPKFWHMKNSCKVRPQNDKKMQNDDDVLFISGDCEQFLWMPREVACEPELNHNV